MKPLLTLFLIATCMAVKGQPVDVIIDDEPLELNDNPHSFPGDEQFQRRTVIITFQNLLDYQAECYKDSMYMPERDVIDMIDIHWFNEDWEMYRFDKHTKTWVLRRRTTFAGFIEFMKRRYK